MVCAILLNYRLNGTYVLDTLASKNKVGRDGSKIQDNEWHVECFSWIAIMFITHFVLPTYLPTHVHALLDSSLPYAFIASMIALNIRDLIHKLPQLQH